MTHLTKINPGSNRNEDNNVATATPGMLDVNISEPKMLEKNKLQCPRCDKTFNSREDYLSHAMARHQMSLSEAMGVPHLSSVPFEKGFHFYTEPGKYTGITAISIDEFAEKLNTVPIESVEFHFQHQDYQKWLKDVFSDDILAGRIDEIKETEETSGDNLRKALSRGYENAIAESKEVLQLNA